ncbi:DUF3040 domain-containing protein [Actinosynnema sp. NPDC091369]
MRWSLWFVLVGLLVASAARTPPVATALATGLVTAGYGARHRCRARLLHHHERLRLRAIERRLEAEDPDFAARLRFPAGADRGRADRPTGWLTAGAAFGVLLTAVGLVGDPGLAVVGVLITLGGVALRVRPARRSGPR